RQYQYFALCMYHNKSIMLLLFSSAQERSHFLSATNVTLNCSFVNDIRAKLYWFKQSLDNTQTMASSYFDKKEFLNEFTNNRRFSLDIENGKINLGMTNVQISDSAVYHCICCVAHQIQFLATVHVIVKELNSGLRVDQRESETVEPGGSLSLNCSVQFGTCDGPHGVHWFKQSEESAPGVLYSHSDQCEKTTDNSCVYSLHVRNLSSEQTGTYYCAVAACGKVLFGNGTKVKIKEKYYSKDQGLVYISDCNNGIIHILNVLCIFCLFLGQGFPKLLQYMATEQVTKSEGRGQRDDTWSECVYFSVEQEN
uniref:Ig-like domain-containing protein n=1 Tax=Neogobius melanostomus TaxID=47308 RepID=A0A8C6SUC7_9GOBI